MAKEIRALGGTRDGTYGVLFLFPIPTPKTYTGGDGQTVTVVPTPAPTEGDVAAALSASEKAQCDAGTLAWLVARYGPDPSRDQAGHVAALQAMYAAEKTKMAARYQATYAHIGRTFDAPA